MTSKDKHEGDYHPPDIQYIEQVLRAIEDNRAYVGSSVRVARPCRTPTCLRDAATMSSEAGRPEGAYDALLREVPRLLDELGRFESEHRQVVRLLLEMIRGEFGLSSEGFKLAKDVPGELGEQRRQALMMYASMTRGQDSRDRVRIEMRLRGEFSEG